MNERMTVAQAVETLNEIAKAKAEGTTRPDAALVQPVADAAAVIAKAKAEKEAAAVVEAPAIRTVTRPVFKSGFGVEDGRRAKTAYRTLIRKSAGKNDDWLRTFHRWNDDVLLAAAALGQSPEVVMKSVPEFREFVEDELGKQSSELAKAIAAATAGAGAEWIPELWSPDLIDLIRIERILLGAFPKFTMTAPTMHLPQYTQEFSTFVIGESTANTPYAIPSIVSNPGTDEVILAAVELAVAAIWSKTFEEDSIVPAVPEIRRRIIEGMAKGIEDALINGSTDSPHPDSDVAASAAATAWNGLRAEAMGSDFSDTSKTVDLSGSNMTAENVLKMKLLQGRFGARNRDSIWLTSPQGLVKLMGLRDASGAQVLLTALNFGSQAVLLTGAIGNLFGSDVVVSDLVKTTLDSTGVVPATPGTKTELILANAKAFIAGDRRSLTIESDTAPLTRQRILVATERMDFKRVRPNQSSTDAPVTIGRNVDTV